MSPVPNLPIVDETFAMRGIARTRLEEIRKVHVEPAENGAEAAPQNRVWGAERLGAAEVQAASDPPDLA